MGDEVDLAAETAEKLRVSPDSHSESTNPAEMPQRDAPSIPASAPEPPAAAATGATPTAPSSGVTKGMRTPSKPGSVPRGFAGANERTRQLASTKLPPGLQAKLEANARRSANTALPPDTDNTKVLNAGQKLDASLLSRAPMPAAPQARAPAVRPNRPGLRLSDLGVDVNAGKASARAPKPSLGGAGGRPKLNLGKLPGGPGPVQPMESPFANFSKIVDPSGRLNFDGKAVLHASGVEFRNGTTFSINMQELELQEQLGFGNYGTVSKVRHTRTKVEMAMKEIRLELDQAKLNAIIMELDILHRAISPYIVEFYGAFFVESCVYYCMEYMDRGSLEKLCGGRYCAVPEGVLARIASCTVKGLSFLKDELQIIHRDIKPTNILINSRGDVKLCDFGVSGQLEKSLAKTNIGCQSYMAPERIKSDPRSKDTTYTTASDVWSLGLTLVEVAKGAYPYPPETFTNVFAQLQAIVDGDAPELPTPSTVPITITSPTGAPIELELGTCTYGADARDFVAQCLRKIPEQRPSYAELLEHPFLKQDAARRIDMRAWVDEAAEAQSARRAANEPSTPSSATAPGPSSAAPAPSHVDA
ncbi:mitogen-activated protein kinase kinase [Malassezia brasiliensis]|uniref:mitogen-activated protein kinase kinase n=1 Tax=Malassezia brasiliensis TaxID=1821822 RepID=A0AAF0IPJ9_9BASI|nr:mitogen-activated protein kinase kinase [Malassezia brasiliensis]